MNHSRALKIAVLALIPAFAVSSARAWGRGGFRGGFGVYVAPGPLWWYDPYYYPYGYSYEPYPYAAYAAPSEPQAPAEAVYDLSEIEDQISEARRSVNQEYSDGDMSLAQVRQADVNIDTVDREARAEAAAGGGYLTRAQRDSLLRSLWTRKPAPAVAAPQIVRPAAAPEAGNLGAVVDLLPGLRRLLDAKLAAGEVTRGQRDAEANALARIEKEARAQASQNGGDLTADQQSALLRRLLQAQDSIQNDLVPVGDR